jgi:glutamyl/glutaminyl-tRNA synthetase
MDITHVIRGDDHLSNTPRQILIYQAFGWNHPIFAHHPLLLGEDRSPLSKRHGSTAVSQFREEGFLPEALLNYLFILGRTAPSGKEILSMENMIEEFSLQSLSRNAPIHSIKKLEWINSHYIKMIEDERLCELLIPYLEKFKINISPKNMDYIKKISSILKENLTILSQVEEYLGIFFDEKFLFENEAKTILNDPRNREFLRKVLNLFDQLNIDKEEEWSSALSKMNESIGRKGRSFYEPLRAAITGKMRGPELLKILPLLGRERIIKRLKMAVELFS